VLQTHSATANRALANRSLERSLQAGLVVSFVVLVFVFWWGGSLTSRLLAESVVQARLAFEGQAVVEQRVGLRNGDVVTDRVRLSTLYDTPLSGRYFRLDTPDKRPILSRSSWDITLPDTQLAAGEQRRLAMRGPSGEPLLLWRGGYQIDGEAVTVTVAEDISVIEERWHAFRVFFAILSLLLLVALLIVQTMIVRHLMAPVDALQQRLKQSRNAAGNLAHALKGPLNLLMRSGDGSQHAERIAQIIDSELKRARLAGRACYSKSMRIKPSTYAAMCPPMWNGRTIVKTCWN